MTKTNLNSSQSKREPFGSRFPEIAVFLKVVFVILFIYIFLDISGRFRCVETPNGLLLGQVNPFTKFEGFEADVAIKKLDGRALFYGDGLIYYWGKRGFAGHLWTPDGTRTGSFVYVNEVGWVFRNETPKLYQKYYDELEPKRPEDGIKVTSNLYYYYLLFSDALPGRLKKSERLFVNRHAFCPTEWFRSATKPILPVLEQH